MRSLLNSKKIIGGITLGIILMNGNFSEISARQEFKNLRAVPREALEAKEDASRDKREISEKKPENYAYFLERGVEFLLEGRHKDALREFRSALKIDNERPEIYYNMGLCYFKLNNMPDAIINYKRAIDLKPAFAEARNNLGVCYIKEKVFEMGLHEIRIANVYGPTMKEALKNLEELKNIDYEYNFTNKLGRPDNKAKQSGPSRAFTLNLLNYPPVVEVPSADRVENVLNDIEVKKAETAAAAETELQNAENSKIAGDYPDFKICFTPEARIENKYNHYWDAINLLKVADELCKDKLYRESLKYYTAAIKIVPDNAHIYYKRGLAKIASNDYNSAEYDFMTAIKKTNDKNLMISATEEIKKLREITFSKY
ncbi:MAG: tetratricopeptide repeat protein [Candidatus Wallbacteria bacterium]